MVWGTHEVELCRPCRLGERPRAVLIRVPPGNGSEHRRRLDRPGGHRQPTVLQGGRLFITPKPSGALLWVRQQLMVNWWLQMVTAKLLWGSGRPLASRGLK